MAGGPIHTHRFSATARTEQFTSAVYTYEVGLHSGQQVSLNPKVTPSFIRPCRLSKRRVRGGGCPFTTGGACLAYLPVCRSAGPAYLRSPVVPVQVLERARPLAAFSESVERANGNEAQLTPELVAMWHMRFTRPLWAESDKQNSLGARSHMPSTRMVKEPVG